MKSSFKAKVKCAQLGLKYIGTGRGFETAIESIGLLARVESLTATPPNTACTRSPAKNAGATLAPHVVCLANHAGVVVGLQPVGTACAF